MRTFNVRYLCSLGAQEYGHDTCTMVEHVWLCTSMYKSALWARKAFDPMACSISTRTKIAKCILAAVREAQYLESYLRQPVPRNSKLQIFGFTLMAITNQQSKKIRAPPHEDR